MTVASSIFLLVFNLESRRADSPLGQLQEDPLPLLCACSSHLFFRGGKLIQIFLSNINLRYHLSIGLSTLFGLVKGDRFGDEMPNQTGRIVTGSFKLLRMANGPCRANLRAETAVHAFTNIDIKVTK